MELTEEQVKDLEDNATFGSRPSIHVLVTSWRSQRAEIQQLKEQVARLREALEEIRNDCGQPLGAFGVESRPHQANCLLLKLKKKAYLALAGETKEVDK